jgi:hypothetical protein
MLQALMLNIVWAAAMQWLMNNPCAADWQHVVGLVQALGGIPDL